MLDIDFGAAYQKASDMAECADEIKRQADKLSEVIAEISRAWQGDTAAKYVQKLETLKSELIANANQCRNDAAAFRRRIDEIKRAEEEAAAQLAAAGI